MSEFNLTLSLEHGVLVVHPKGYLDLGGGTQVLTTCQARLADGPTAVVFDLTESPVINSSGLAKLFELVAEVVQSHNLQVGVVGLSSLGQNAFRATGLLALVTVFPDLPAAVTQLAKR